MSEFLDLPLSERQALERDFYLGKSKIDPRTGKSLAESRADHKAATEAAKDDLAQRMERFKDRDAEIVRQPDPPVVVTNLPDARALGRLDKTNLVEQSASEGLDLAGDETKDEIVEKIIAHRNEDAPAVVNPDADGSESDGQ